MTDLKQFYIELFKYYMEFLQTDFKSQTGPNRFIAYENKDGLLCDIDLSTYPQINPLFMRFLLSNLTKNPLGAVKRNSHVIKLPQALITYIIEAYEDKVEIQEILKKAKLDLNRQGVTLREDFLSEFQDNGNIEFEELRSYLERYNAHNLYEDLFEMWKNKMQLEEDEFYFYFFDISFKGKKYPLFYVQVIVERNEQGEFSFELSPTLLINKKAIEYITSKYSKETNKSSQTISVPLRQVYISDYSSEKKLISYLQDTVLNDLCTILELPPIDVFSNELTQTQNASIQITNTCYISLANKSDEALLNDYEELQQLALKGNNNESLELFKKIGDDFLFNNPQAFESIIEEEYDNLPLQEKLAYRSPIPLNKEQLLILKAVEKEYCNRIIVEGPPGTGKSHTIVSIIFNALLQEKSVLVVSDTKEALDVIESKINDVLEKIELNEKMENPILRLGKRETNFNNIYTSNNFGKIKSRYNSFKSLSSKTENEIVDITENIKNNISQEIQSQMAITPDKLKNLIKYEKYFTDNWMEYLDFEEIKDSVSSLMNLWEATQTVINNYKTLSQEYGFRLLGPYMSVPDFSQLITQIQNDFTSFELKIKKDYNRLIFIDDIDVSNIHVIETALKEVDAIKWPIVNTLWFRSKQIKQIELNLNEVFFNSDISSIKNNDVQSIINNELLLYKQLQRLNDKWLENDIDFFSIAKGDRWNLLIQCCKNMIEALKRIQSIAEDIPKSFQLLRLNIEDINTVYHSKLVDQKELDIRNLSEYIETHLSTLEGSIKSVGSSYNDERNQLQKRLIMKMTNILDRSVVAFREGFKNDSEEIRRRVRAKKKLTKDSLKKLVKAFPCLIVGVRELGEYLPLAPDLFDIVIIDEASQVSIAQAFPAIIRGKKVVVLGDQKQYTNFKSSHVSTSVNNTFFNQVRDEFAKSILHRCPEEQETLLFKMKDFNVKTSILDFIRNITNYQSDLKKHARGYIELIGYSNEKFYNESLQVMKIRGMDINEVIKFHVLTEVSDSEAKKNINKSEAYFILNELIKLRDDGYQGTVGIITPFAHQHKFISNLIYTNENQPYFEEHFKLKIMTFDSCQGEEREIVFYSMVERENQDILKSVFLLQFDNLDNEELNSRYATRLNVGLSRVQESMRFVLSKQPENIRGEVGNALRHFRNVLRQTKSYVVAEESNTDIVEYIKKTDFYKVYEQDIELISDFDAHQYIKQLDRQAIKSKFKSYVLMTVSNGLSKAKTAIIEYDCMDENLVSVIQDDIIYDKRFVESDIETRKTIEAYGYPFFRVNKFLMDYDPEAEFLNEYFVDVLKKK